MINLIKIYINKIKKEDMNIFLKNNNINLSEKELEYAYYIIKNKYELILNNNKSIFDDIKENISEDNYIKLMELYNNYKTKYFR
ncbi:MAG: hypothetical protein J5970_02845 [Bacilli bacterium]|nr:hypothetical protein [Bacilli bacterium]